MLASPALFFRALLLAVAWGLADYCSKAWLVTHLDIGESRAITGFFNLVSVRNHGVSFGLLNHGAVLSPYVFVGLAVVAAVVLLLWLVRVNHAVTALALGLIIGGALGNGVDRVRYGAVVDFLDFHAFGYHWPAFNLADSGIVVGVSLLLLQSLVFGKKL